MHRPKRLYGENVKNLEQSTPHHPMDSDAEYCLDSFRKLGYYADSWTLRAQQYGSLPARARWLLHAIRNDVI